MKRVWASRGFTLVELLIVIVVIAILAAITIVAYGGVSAKAHVSAVQSTLKQAATQLDNARVTSGSYPADQTSAALKSSSDIALHYYKASSSDDYCLDGTYGSTVSYEVTNSNNTPQAGTCTTTGLVSEWPLNGNATDVVGSNNGTINGATATTGQNGASSGALLFAGTQSIAMTDTNLPTGSADRSVFAWVNFTSIPTAAWAMIDSYGTTSPNGATLALGVTSSGTVGCVGSNDTFSSTAVLAAGTWYLIGCEITDNGGTGTVYINNVSRTGAMPIAINTVSSGSNYISRYLTANYYMPGTIDDVRIYNRALTPGEVQALIANGAA